MESPPPDYPSEAQYAAPQTDLPNLASPNPTLGDCLSLASPRSSTTSFAPSLFPGLYRPIFCQLSCFNLWTPRRAHHVVEAPHATIAPQLTFAIPPAYTPSHIVTVLPQSNSILTRRSTKRNREETEESVQGPKPAARKKRRAVKAQARLAKPLADIDASSGLRGPAVLSACCTEGRSRSSKAPAKTAWRRATLSRGIENVPIPDNQEPYGRLQDRAETRSRSRVIGLDDSPGILNAASRADVPNSNPPIGARAAADPGHCGVSILPGDPTWYTPAFYEELRNIADSLVAQNQAPTSNASGASDPVAQYGHRIDEALPGPSVPRALCSKSQHASTRMTLGGSGQASSSGHLAVGSSAFTSGVARKKFLCPFADSSGACHGRTCKKGNSQGRKTRTQVSDSEEEAGEEPKTPKPSTFSRPTDVDRHVLSVHMSAKVYCKRPHEGGHPLPFARYDGFQRHLRYTSLQKGEPFVMGLSGLRVARTALSLERWLRTNAKIEDIRRCDCCAKLTDEEIDASQPPPFAIGGFTAPPVPVYSSEIHG
ncbi:hypothetical protein LXA43DRAFT_1157385 [Ganoderma leucocontextum]|nr:hypothetical protein LXA43DRAFT_1157385 [Ganoderma leucocontextum]